MPLLDHHGLSCKFVFIIMWNFQRLWVSGKYSIIEIIVVIRAEHDDIFRDIRTTVFLSKRLDRMDMRIPNLLLIGHTIKYRTVFMSNSISGVFPIKVDLYSQNLTASSLEKHRVAEVTYIRSLYERFPESPPVLHISRCGIYCSDSISYLVGLSEK